ncbi:MAG: T9SS type A sorting domain-containing protein [bacterium]
MPKTLLLLLLLATVTTAQQIYTIPFASKGNTIELTISNSSSEALTAISIEVVDVPAWVSYTQQKQVLALLKGKQELPVTFSFSLDNSAPVGSDTKLKFVITSKDGNRWEKEIAIKVSPPETFELFQNYPNPFNPSTTIAYQLPKEAHINLRIFNMLGQQVTTLVDAEKAAGYFKETFDASRYASGAYIYVLTTTENSGTKQIARKAMMLVK